MYKESIQTRKVLSPFYHWIHWVSYPSSTTELLLLSFFILSCLSPVKYNFMIFFIVLHILNFNYMVNIENFFDSFYIFLSPYLICTKNIVESRSLASLAVLSSSVWNLTLCTSLNSCGNKKNLKNPTKTQKQTKNFIWKSKQQKVYVIV